MPKSKHGRKRAPVKLLPSAEYLVECFYYNRKTGILIWLKRPAEHFSNYRSWKSWNARFPGSMAGGIRIDGYRHVRICRLWHMAHRIIWKMVTGKEPLATIDHVDGDKGNNSWINLRQATDFNQKWNQSLFKNNSSGFRGVHLHQCGKWEANIKVNREQHYLGLFDTPEEASAAYEAAAKKLHGEFFLPHGKRRRKQR